MSSILSFIVERLYVIPGILIGLSVHEYGHAKVAQMCGDKTGEYQGRVSLDPRAHIDPVGIIALLLVGFGWGKPVMIDPRQFRHPRRDQILVGLAGVFNNLICALVFAFVYRFALQLLPRTFLASTFGGVVVNILLEIVVINLSLMIFNLIPIPPLDGFGVVCGIFNLYGTKFYWYARRYGMIVLIIMMYFGITGNILRPALSAVLRLVFSIASVGL
ncbi:MAG: site-2 protease family protein [Firmicutes bacterium]|nr:site-2 protease family protein [Bacillota bacterium]